MKKFALIFATLSLSACIAPVDQTGAVILPVPVGVPVLVTDIKDKNDSTTKDKNNSIYVCKIKAFTNTYTAENQSRGRARLDVKNKCTANHHEMFCRDTDIECTQYN